MSIIFPSCTSSSFFNKSYGRNSHSLPSATLNDGLETFTEANTNHLQLESSKDQIRKLFDNVQLSVSSYDTAWVALVPSPASSQTPCFPECIFWLLDNQHSNGSWGLPSPHHLLTKDAISSTLASILALKRWGVGREQIDRGLHFIESNAASVTDENQLSPIGFEIIFPGLVNYAESLNLNIPFGRLNIDAMFQRRELELKRRNDKSYLAYISEGMGKSHDWDMVMKYQRKNGSILNSPSATAAAYMHLKDPRCLDYLRTLVVNFGDAVPTASHLDIYLRLCVVDNVERLGIARHFKKEIKNVLDETYRYWLQGEEEIYLDNATCAMAFRLLRLNGYDVSSDHIMGITEEKLDLGSHGGYRKGIDAALELYRASDFILDADESALEKKKSWCREYLKRKLYVDANTEVRIDMSINQEVDDAIKFPYYAALDRTASKSAIEHYNVDSLRILKTSYSSPNIRNEDFLKLAVEDFNTCQVIHREELESLERWVVENKFDKLEFARIKPVYVYYTAAATIFSPELSYARMTWAKTSMLAIVIDDFFDVGGSMQELENLIQLIQKWDVNVAVECCSQQVQIIFSALHSTVCDIGAKAFTYQRRDVTGHIVELWLDMVKAMWREAKWTTDKYVPTMDEYMSNAYVSFGIGPGVLPSLYILGPKLSRQVVSSIEYHNLFKLMSTWARLLNDIHSFERESKAGKLNALSLLMNHSGKNVFKNTAVKEMKSMIVNQRRELLRLVLQKEGSLVPQACKDLFWKMSIAIQTTYSDGDGFTADYILDTARAILHEPVSLIEL